MNAAVMPTYREEISDQEINITPTAREQLARLFTQVDDDDIEAIRIFVSGGGCSGMSYGMTFTDQQTPYDRVLQYDDFSIYVDAVAMNYLHGVEIDFISRPTGASFVFNNVFASTGGSGTCGACGAAVGAGGGCG
jgi:iron-sulfur cluster insertion protein